MQTKNDRIKIFYEKKGLTQEEFAKEIGASQQYISAVVNNKRNIGSNILNKIKKRYDDFNEYWFITGGSKTEEIPFFEKDGMKIHIKEILMFIIDNEEMLRKDKQFNRFLTEIGREAILKYYEDNKFKLK